MTSQEVLANGGPFTRGPFSIHPDTPNVRRSPPRRNYPPRYQKLFQISPLSQHKTTKLSASTSVTEPVENKPLRDDEEQSASSSVVEEEISSSSVVTSNHSPANSASDRVETPLSSVGSSTAKNELYAPSDHHLSEHSETTRKTFSKSSFNEHTTSRRSVSRKQAHRRTMEPVLCAVHVESALGDRILQTWYPAKNGALAPSSRISTKDSLPLAHADGRRSGTSLSRPCFIPSFVAHKPTFVTVRIPPGVTVLPLPESLLSFTNEFERNSAAPSTERHSEAHAETFCNADSTLRVYVPVPHTSIQELKARLSRQVSISPASLQLLCSGQLLDDNFTIDLLGSNAITLDLNVVENRAATRSCSKQHLPNLFSSAEAPWRLRAAEAPSGEYQGGNGMMQEAVSPTENSPRRSASQQGGGLTSSVDNESRKNRNIHTTLRVEAALEDYLHRMDQLLKGSVHDPLRVKDPV